MNYSIEIALKKGKGKFILSAYLFRKTTIRMAPTIKMHTIIAATAGRKYVSIIDVVGGGVEFDVACTLLTWNAVCA